MKTLGYYNGNYDEIDRMTVPMDDRASFFGDGVYDATCCGNYKIFNLEEHLDRFYRSAAMMRIEIPMEKDALGRLLCALVHKLDSPDQFVYWQVTRGTAPRNHLFPQGVPANLWITLRPSGIGDMEHERLRLLSVPDTRFYHCNAKTLNLLPNVMASQRALEAGCDEVVFYREGDRVTECAHSNVSMLKDGVFHTAPTDNLILPGIARAHLIKMCGKLGIPVEEKPFTLQQLREADEIIVSSSSHFCMRAVELDGQAVGCKDSERLSALQAALLDEYLTATEQK